MLVFRNYLSFNSWLVECLIWGKVGLELHSGLILTVWDSLLRVVWRYTIAILILFGGDGFPTFLAPRSVELFIEAQTNVYQMKSQVRSFRRPVERHDPRKCWPMSVLLDFQCSNENLAHWLIHCGTGRLMENALDWLSYNGIKQTDVITFQILFQILLTYCKF